MYFKIKGTYFEICALCFFPFPMYFFGYMVMSVKTNNN